jgi:hypothetical protein
LLLASPVSFPEYCTVHTLRFIAGGLRRCHRLRQRDELVSLRQENDRLRAVLSRSGTPAPPSVQVRMSRRCALPASRTSC